MRANWQIEVKEARARCRVNLPACSEDTHVIILDLQPSSELTPDPAQGEFFIGVSELFDSHDLEYVSVVRGHDCDHSLCHSRPACSSEAYYHQGVSSSCQDGLFDQLMQVPVFMLELYERKAPLPGETFKFINFESCEWVQ